MKFFSACHLPSSTLRRLVISVLGSRSKAMKKFSPCFSPTFSICHVRDGQQGRSLENFFSLLSSEFLALLFRHPHVGGRSKALKNFSSCSLRLLQSVIFVPDSKGEVLKIFSSCSPPTSSLCSLWILRFVMMLRHLHAG